MITEQKQQASILTDEPARTPTTVNSLRRHREEYCHYCHTIGYDSSDSTPLCDGR